jgi:hypothetical protein
MKKLLIVTAMFGMLPGLGLAQTKQATNALMLVTATGTTVGRFSAAASGGPAVIINVGKRVIELRLHVTNVAGYVWGGPSQLLYPTADCSGKAYLFPSNYYSTNTYASIAPGSTDAAPRALIQTGPAETITYRSYLDNGVCNTQSSATIPLIPTAEVPLPRPPFYVQ